MITEEEIRKALDIKGTYNFTEGASEDIYTMLNKIQTELKVPKNQYNKYGNYSFRNAEDIIEAVKPLLKELGVVLILTDRVEEVAGKVYVCATAKLYNKYGYYIEARAYAREKEQPEGIMSEPMLTGSASSYARKYALNGLFALDDPKDPDDNIEAKKEAKKEEPVEDSKPKPSPKQLKIIKDNLEPVKLDSVLGSMGFRTIEELDKDSASAIVKKIFDGVI